MPARADLPTVEYVDLQRYLGLWYEIARLPMWAEDEGASDVTAEYAMGADGRIVVTNRCINENGEPEVADGSAEVVDAITNAKLQVSFLPKGLRWIPFAKGDYWILKLDARYNVALVGTPDRKYLWLLARNAQLDGKTRLEFLEYAQSLGFDLDRLIMPDQSGAIARGSDVPLPATRVSPTNAPTQTVTDDDFWLLEQKFWTGDAPFYASHLDDASLMVFPAPLGTLDRTKTLAAVEAQGRWENVAFVTRQLLKPRADVAVLVYEAKAQRGSDDYAAHCISLYLKQGDAWMLVTHQQTPSWVDLTQVPARVA